MPPAGFYTAVVRQRRAPKAPTKCALQILVPVDSHAESPSRFWIPSVEYPCLILAQPRFRCPRYSPAWSIRALRKRRMTRFRSGPGSVRASPAKLMKVCSNVHRANQAFSVADRCASDMPRSTRFSA